MPPRPRGALEVGDVVYLRRPSVRDKSEFVRLVRESRAFLRPWVFTAPQDAEEFNEFLRRVRRDNADGLLVCRREDDAIVGVYLVSQIVRGALNSGYLAYYSFMAFTGRGYMTEGLGLVLRHVFGPMKLHRVEANIQPHNAPSIALVRRFGFRLEGYSPRYLKIGGSWRDHERWALTIEDWRAGRSRR